MPRAKQPARKGSSSKAFKKAATKRKEEKAPYDEDMATLPSENDGELGESSLKKLITQNIVPISSGLTLVTFAGEFDAAQLAQSFVG